MDIKSIGTNADKVANVDISKVHNGYFADEENINTFIRLGIAPIESNFPDKIKYVDFGGGQGHLAKGVKDYLEKQSFLVEEIVADANENYLDIAQKKGLKTSWCNLESCDFPGTDLITMRAVLHYNSPDNQISILKDVYNSLNSGGYFVHQNSSGNKENCELRSLIVNIQELGRAGAGNYHWVSEDEYIELLKKVGFTEIVHSGYAPENSWGPDQQWDRFNKEITDKALIDKNQATIDEIEDRKKKYLTKANQLISDYAEKYGAEYLGVKKEGDGKIVIEYQYPIIIARK
jgi:hypothetical protein